ncbi:DUF4365 domain-containing protein [Lentzea sp. HUAS TT2]|uniref:DUF4365 domain-containing protein n=1 Tax=Lentzea sp. HUAS TT2 TaxID=3447454 RepID=UPI003F70A15E
MAEVGRGSDATNREGVSFVGFQIEREFGWIFREQSTSDFGVDAHVEIRSGANPTGRLLGLQLKSSAVGFSERVADGWIYRPDGRHVEYWLGHSLPMYVLYVDLTNDQIYWQRVVEGNLARSSKGGWKLHIPFSNVLGTAGAEWELATSGVEMRAENAWFQNLEVLPPSSIKHLTSLSSTKRRSAHLIAHHLADGRRVPKLVVETLLEAMPIWIVEGGVEGLVAIGDYASAHLAPMEAARAYERAATILPSKNGRILAAAAFELLEIDVVRARELFDRASRQPSSELLGSLGLQILKADPLSAAELVLPPELTRRVEAARDDLAMVSFRAQQAVKAGRINEGVALWEQALQLAPENSTAMQKFAYVLALRSGSSEANADDLTRARNHAEKALDQLHAWDGPTEEALDLLMQIYGLTAEFDRILNRSTTLPIGTARADEAARPKIARHAARAAAMLGRPELLPELLDKIPSGVERDLVAAECDLHNTGSAEERVELFRRILASTGDDEPDRMVESVRRLSTFGIDETARIRHLVDLGWLQSSVVDLIRVVARAYADPDNGISALRALSDDNAAAVEPLIYLLLREGRQEEAQAVCARAAERLRNSTFLVMRAEILSDLGRWGEVEATAHEALGDTGLSQTLAKSMYNLLMLAAQERGDWPAVERCANQFLSRSSEQERDRAMAWRLIIAQLNQRAFGRAAQTVRRFRPTVTDPQEAQLWLRALVLEPWDSDLASQALALAARFESDAELNAALLTAVIRSTRTLDEAQLDSVSAETVGDDRPIVPQEIHRRAFAALNEHVRRHGEAGGVFAFAVGDSAQMLHRLEELATKDEVAKDANEALQEVARHVWIGELPVGLLAAAIDYPYAQILVSRAIGAYSSSSFIDDEYEADGEAARICSIGSMNVIVDASALLVSSVVGEFDYCRGLFTELRMPYASRDDIVRAQVAFRGIAGSSGSISWDASSHSLVWRESSIDSRIELRQRMSLLAAAADRTTAVPVQANATYFESMDRRSNAHWLSPVDLAIETGLPLWTDDVAQRRLARSLGVATFGTVSLLQLRDDAAIVALDADSEADELAVEAALLERQASMRRYLAQRIVDLPFTVDDIIAQASLDNWDAEAAIVPLSRHSWWRWAATPVTDIWTIFKEVAARHPEKESNWRHAAMVGVAASCVGISGSGPSLVLAVLALLPLSEGEVQARSKEFLKIARRVAKEWEMPDPREHVPAAAEKLAAIGVVHDVVATVDAALSEQP